MPVIVYDTANTFLHGCASEIEEQPYGLFPQPQIGQELFEMRAGEFLNRLDFDDQPLRNEQIDAKGGRVMHSTKFNVDRHLSGDLQAAPFQLSRQYNLIDAFQQAGTKLLVNPETGVDNLSGYRIDIRPVVFASLRLRVNLKSPSRNFRGLPWSRG